MNINKAIIVGRVGADPMAKEVNGSIVTTFSVATSKNWVDKKSGEKKELTEWHNIVLWNRIAEVARDYVVKGMLVGVEGRMQTRTYDKNGVTMYRTEILADNFQLGPRSGEGGAARPATTKAAPKKAAVKGKVQQEVNDFDKQEAEDYKNSGGASVDADNVNPEDIPF